MTLFEGGSRCQTKIEFSKKHPYSKGDFSKNICTVSVVS
jgi:hypothetical protein